MKGSRNRSRWPGAQPRWKGTHTLEVSTLWTLYPFVDVNDFSGASIFCITPLRFKALSKNIVRGGYLLLLASIVGCLTMSPIYFRNLPKESSVARWPKIKSTEMFWLNSTLKISYDPNYPVLATLHSILITRNRLDRYQCLSLPFHTWNPNPQSKGIKRWSLQAVCGD